MWWWAIRLLRMDRQVETTTSAEKVQRGRCYWARLLFSRSQPPRRAASRCCASRDTTCRGSATMRGKCCVDSHAFRDEGKWRELTHSRIGPFPELSNWASPPAEPEVSKMTMTKIKFRIERAPWAAGSC